MSWFHGPHVQERTTAGVARPDDGPSWWSATAASTNVGRPAVAIVPDRYDGALSITKGAGRDRQSKTFREGQRPGPGHGGKEGFDSVRNLVACRNHGGGRTPTTDLPPVRTAFAPSKAAPWPPPDFHRVPSPLLCVQQGDCLRGPRSLDTTGNHGPALGRNRSLRLADGQVGAHSAQWRNRQLAAARGRICPVSVVPKKATPRKFEDSLRDFGVMRFKGDMTFFQPSGHWS